MALQNEIKRKLFHHLSLVYMLLYAALPRLVTLWLLGVALGLLSAVEWLRLRRPELNAWFLQKFGGIHRESEIMRFSGIFWTLLGCWLTMVIFQNAKIVYAALGFLVFGDTAAALGGMRWGKTPWPDNPGKTKEGSIAFAAASTVWASLFLFPPVALLGACAAAWVEKRKWKWNDNFWIPVLGALALSFFNLFLGRRWGIMR